MKIVSTTVKRHAPVTAGGCVRITDWTTGEQVAERPVFPTNPSIDDPNPRGNSRGGRGVVICDGAIVVANYHTLEVCDGQLRPIGTISKGNFAGIHELSHRGERLFVASTANNSAAELSLEAIRAVVAGENCAMPAHHWWPTENAEACEQLGIPQTLYPNKFSDNRLRHLDLHNRGKAGHLHLNAVDADANAVYALLNKPGVILRLDTMQVVLRHPSLEGAHNLNFIAPNRAWVVSTRTGRLVECDVQQGEVRPIINLNETPFAKKVLAKRWWGQRWPLGASSGRNSATRPLFWRGLAVNDDWILIGTSPAAILVFDRRTQAYHSVLPFSRDVREIIHGIACWDA